MPLVYSAILPHTPLLVPAIGKEKRETLANTITSYATVREHIGVHAVESIIILAPHAPQADAFFQLQHSTTYKTSFEEFGDLVTTKKYRPDHILIDYLKHHFDNATIPWVYHTHEYIEYGASVPLICLELDMGIPVTVIYPPVSIDLAPLYRAGIGLYDAIASHPRRIAVLASADLAHTLSQDAPGGFEKNAQAFDKRIMTIFNKKQFDALLTTKQSAIDEVKTCSMPILAILAGVLKNVPYQPSALSYESPLGVGHLAMEFIV